ncbi:hypothetical protein [Acetobacterium sp.]|uniref:hypothetical protein n=1 Tax=Acetobacterium sp. TaxID=1872094 RepID=UPI002F414508
MFESNLKTLGLVIVTLVCLIGLLAGCGQGSTSTKDDTNTKEDPQKKEAMYNLYNKVELKQTKEQVDTELGVTPTELSTDIYDYADKSGYGVSVGFSSIMAADNTTKEVITKRLSGWEKYLTTAPDADRITDEQAARITEGMTFDEVKSILGTEGFELSRTQNYQSAPAIERIWIKKGLASMMSVTFSGPEGTDKVALVANV